MRTVLLILVASIPTHMVFASSFDWRDYGVVSPVRNGEPSNGTVVDRYMSHDFAAVAALESSYAITTSTSAVVLSPQYLDDEPRQHSSSLYDAMLKVVKYGTVVDSLDPFYGHNHTIPTLTKPYTIYRPSDFVSLPNDTAVLKDWLSHNGPIITEVDNATYCWDWNEWEWDASIWGNHPVVKVAWGTNDAVQSGITSGTWTCINLIGFEDDTSWPGGGYWICKSNLPTTVGPWVAEADGTGEIAYAALGDNDTIVSTDLGYGRAFYGLGPAGSLTYDTDNSVVVTGTFRMNSDDVPDGSGLIVGNWTSPASPVPEASSLNLVLAFMLIVVVTRLTPLTGNM